MHALLLCNPIEFSHLAMQNFEHLETFFFFFFGGGGGGGKNIIV